MLRGALSRAGEGWGEGRALSGTLTPLILSFSPSKSGLPDLDT